MTDFTRHAHPVMAVACPDCRASAGTWCRRPSGHRAADFHRARKEEADTRFMEIHGAAASVERQAGTWIVDPTGRSRAGR